MAVIIISPLIGRWVETAHRLQEAHLALWLQNGAIWFSSFIAAIYFARSYIHFDDDLAHQLCPVGIVFFAAVSKVWSNGYTLILEHDWLVALVRDKNEMTGNH